VERLARYKHSNLQRKWSVVNVDLGEYLQNFIFFVSYKWAQSARVLYYSRFEKLARYKHSSLMGPFTSLEQMQCFEYEPKEKN
jgi:hypothetical protein